MANITHVLLNTSEGFKYELSEGEYKNPNADLIANIMSEIKETCEKRIGRATLVSLLRGDIATSGEYTIIELDQEVREILDGVEDETGAVVEPEKSAVEVETSKPVEETVSEPEVVVVTQTEKEEVEAEEPATEYTEEQIAAAKKLIGVNTSVKKGDFVERTSNRSYTRRDETMDKARSSHLAPMIEALEKEGLLFVFCEPDMRWLQFEIPTAKGHDPEKVGRAKNTYLDLSPLKNGGYAAGLYVQGKSIGAGNRYRFDEMGYCAKLNEGKVRPKDWVAVDALEAFTKFVVGSVQAGGAFEKFFK